MTSTDSSTDKPTDFSTLTEPRRVSGGEGELGHMDELRTDPIGLFWRVREECGDLGVFKIVDRDICLASGA
ncbi:cytochrome P450, partial [Acinetobacter baumannii]|nr:cytochrome P450 [Acinetobacter baumannii]